MSPKSRAAEARAKAGDRGRLRQFDIDVFLIAEDGATPEWWRVARVQYDVEAVVESALDNIRALVEAAKGPLADKFVAQKASEENMSADELKRVLRRHADHAFQRARRELRQLTREAFEPLMREAIEMTGEFLAAAAMDRMPDSFGPQTRREAREFPIEHASKMLGKWLTVGRPRSQPPLPEEAAEFVRLSDIGRALFGAVRRPLEGDVLTAVAGELRARLSDRRERAAAEDVLKALRHQRITGVEIQPKKLGLRFAANVMGLSGSIRTLQRLYDDAVKTIKP
ncbi:MAG: hypothetical protein JO093_15695 [Acidobacteria bacterium]|nr:hypothetical protein [Acidobacteriota bacterium]MBV9070963.1 hypothetical protein [Acidobacteriota bacterium]MBV9187058.1 hypothetical protein [Acidobacteriota bacterium]